MSVGATMERGVLRLTIDVPESRNALDHATVAALRKALTSAREEPDLRLVQIESAIARVFSIGMDLEKLNTQPDAGVWESFAAITDYADLLIDLATMPVTTLAIVDGVAAAGGVELACICDTVIGTSNAAFSIAQLRKGIFPFITSAVLTPRIGQSRFLHWALSGQTFSARKLLELGLVNQLCAPEERERTTAIFVDRVLGFDPPTLKAGIVALRAEVETDVRARIRHALSLFTLNCLALRGTAK